MSVADILAAATTSAQGLTFAFSPEDTLLLEGIFELQAVKVADRADVTLPATDTAIKPGQIALAWLLHYSPVMLPIPGTHSVAHLQQNIAAQKIRLDRDDMAALAGMA